MLTADIAVIGGGISGLHAAIEAANNGAKVQIIDENNLPGGQLHKQIHKFFGSHRHYAGVRGIDIGKRLLKDAENAGVDILSGSFVFGVNGFNIGFVDNTNRFQWLKAKTVVLCCGASEKTLLFPGWTLPGVMGAGAVQTLVNIHRVLPGKRFLMVGSGNVGLVVSYQLMQAGVDVLAVIEAQQKIGGWGVHASKLLRCDIPILTSHTIKDAVGTDRVDKATAIKIDEKFEFIQGSEETFSVDVICLAVGLKPNIELPLMMGCKTLFLEALGGRVPIHDENMESTVNNIFIAGDCAGVEEASTAIESGRLAGISAAEKLGYITKEEAVDLKTSIREVLKDLRSGPFGETKLKAKKILVNESHKLREKEVLQ
jgi:thioredoxin reductase